MYREPDSATQGMTKKERRAYVKDYPDYSNEDDPEEMEAMSEARELTPQIEKDYIHRMEQKLVFLREYIWQKGLVDKAQSYVDANNHERIPFNW